jgi:hypothetical protein
MKGVEMNVLPKTILLAFALSATIPTVVAQDTGGTQFTLTAGTDYTFLGPGHPVDCPQCKSLFYATHLLNAPAGMVISSITVVDRKPDVNNHWKRCQIEVSCGVEEFSDANEHNKSCVGTPSCMVWRATDAAAGKEYDVINVRWRKK